jgi:hypothetical protein
MRRSNTKPLIALITAYVLALQAMLTGMTLSARAGETVTLQFVLCAANSSKPEHAPADTMPCWISAACCPSASDPGALPVALVVPVSIERTGFFGLPSIVNGMAAIVGGPQQPRAPPAA